MARSSFKSQLLTLFSYCRKVCVDRAEETITIRTRYLWFLCSVRTVPFDRIWRINYSYSSFPTSWSLWVGTTDEVEKYIVSLELTSPRETVKLFSFVGEGAVETGWAGVIFGRDRIIDFAGDQDDASRSYIDLLKEFTGKSLV